MVILPENKTDFGVKARTLVISIKIGLNFKEYFSLRPVPTLRPILMVSPMVGTFIFTFLFLSFSWRFCLIATSICFSLKERFSINLVLISIKNLLLPLYKAISFTSSGNSSNDFGAGLPKIFSTAVS